MCDDYCYFCCYFCVYCVVSVLWSTVLLERLRQLCACYLLWTTHLHESAYRKTAMEEIRYVRIYRAYITTSTWERYTWWVRNCVPLQKYVIVDGNKILVKKPWRHWTNRGVDILLWCSCSPLKNHRVHYIQVRVFYTHIYIYTWGVSYKRIFSTYRI